MRPQPRKGLLLGGDTAGLPWVGRGQDAVGRGHGIIGAVTHEFDLTLTDGQTLHVYDTGAPEGGAALTVFWHHGTPNIGAPPAPLFEASTPLGIRWVSFYRPGYGGSTPQPDRNIGSAAALVATVADHPAIDHLARHCPAMQLRLSPGDGHLSVLRHGTAALEWLATAF